MRIQTAAIYIAGCLCLPSAAQIKADTETVRGVYTNSKYLYSVTVPSEMLAKRMRAPAPNHGVSIYPRHGQEEMIWVNGEYDVLALGSAKALATEIADSLATSYHLRVQKDTGTRLADMPAREADLRGDNGPGRVNYMRIVVALLSLPTGPGIVYTVGMQSSSGDRSLAAEFSRVVASFHVNPP